MACDLLGTYYYVRRTGAPRMAVYVPSRSRFTLIGKGTQWYRTPADSHHLPAANRLHRGNPAHSDNLHNPLPQSNYVDHVRNDGRLPPSRGGSGGIRGGGTDVRGSGGGRKIRIDFYRTLPSHWVRRKKGESALHQYTWLYNFRAFAAVVRWSSKNSHLRSRTICSA
jgi:hypothetical protein